METLGWNPLLDERSHASMMFPGFAAAATTTTLTTARPPHRPLPHLQLQPQTAHQLHQQRAHQGKVSFSVSDYDDLDGGLPLPSPAFSSVSCFEETFVGEQGRSPSIGVGSSLAAHDLDDPCNWRPSSVAQFFFPKVGSELPYDYDRARSAIPPPSAYPSTFYGARPDSSAGFLSQEAIQEDAPSDEEPLDESDEHWTEWNIKTAPGCPALDQLFENKRRWRNQFNQSIPPPLQRHCVFCKSISKPPSVFLSHAIRNADGDITCPVLKVYKCPICGLNGHTVRYCAQNKNNTGTGNSRHEGSTSSSRDGSSPHPTSRPSSSTNWRSHSRLGSSSNINDGRSIRSSMGFY